MCAYFRFVDIFSLNLKALLLFEKINKQGINRRVSGRFDADIRWSAITLYIFM